MRVFLFLFVFYSISMSQKISSIPLSKSTLAPSKADTSYIGAGLLAKGGGVSVKWSKCYTQEIGEVYFMDSLSHPRFLFHNTIGAYNEDTIIDLGSFPPGRPIVFAYRKITDDVSPFEPILLEKSFYTGLSRVGIDPYISEYKHSMGWAAPGRLNSDTIEVSYEDSRGTMYDAVLFEVTNVFIEGLEKCKVPYVHFSDSSQTFKDKIDIMLSVKVEGLSIIIQSRINDTITADISKLRIYYTTDGTMPSSTSSRYTNGSITINKTTNLKVIALIEGDTNWFPSEVVSAKYIKEGDVSINGKDRNAVLKQCNFGNNENCYFDISGRKVNLKSNHKINGVYLVKLEKEGICKRFVNTDFSK